MVSVGDRKTDVETPSLCLDLNRFEANLKQVANITRDSGKGWRPNAKCHKSPAIAKRQMKVGAIGLTCANVSEAEVFVAAGITEILIAHLPVGAKRVQRIAMLCRAASPLATCDHYVQAESLSAECVRQGVVCRVLVELNVGMDRTGVRPGRDAIELARGIERLPGLKLNGIMGYEGHAMSIRNATEKQRSIDASMGILSHTRDVFLKNGLCCDIVSAGGTGSLFTIIRCEALTEVQAGGAIFGDPYYTSMPDVEGFTPALTVLCTVISRPGFDRAVLDAGKKSITSDVHPPTVKDWPDAKIQRHDSEQIVLELGPNSRELRIGDRLELIVGCADLTTLLHEQYLCFRNDRIEEIWQTETRGKLI